MSYGILWRSSCIDRVRQTDRETKQRAEMHAVSQQLITVNNVQPGLGLQSSRLYSHQGSVSVVTDNAAHMPTSLHLSHMHMLIHSG